MKYLRKLSPIFVIPHNQIHYSSIPKFVSLQNLRHPFRSLSPFYRTSGARDRIGQVRSMLVSADRSHVSGTGRKKSGCVLGQVSGRTSSQTSRLANSDTSDLIVRFH